MFVWLSRSVYQAELSSAFLVAAILATWLVLWRVWRFTVRPYLRPQDPKELPYWIPCHALSFFQNSDKLIERGLDFTRRTHEPFALQVGFNKFYIVTGPRDVAEVYRKVSTLNWDGHLTQVLTNFGFKGSALDLAWHKPIPGEKCYVHKNPVNPKQLPLIKVIEEIYIAQLLPGIHMTEMSSQFIKSLKDSIHPSNLDFCTLQMNGRNRRVSLRNLARYTLVEAATFSMFGHTLHRLNPDIVQNMLDFNDQAWMVFFGLPEMFSSKVAKARRTMTETMKQFANLPEIERVGQAWGIQQVLKAQETVGIDIDSRACMLLLIFWAANSNEYNITFWLIAHLVSNSTLLEQVKAEIEMGWKDGELDIKHLCANAPTLDGAFHESLRLNGGAMMSRKVLEPTMIGDKLLQAGTNVLMPSRQLHMNEQVWGDDYKHFNSRRFIEDKGLLKHSSYRPFGGGVSYCPGRVMAKEQVYAFIAILFRRFDVKLAQGLDQKFPVLDESTPSLGITGPVKNMDVLMDLTEKSY
ncbi:cytochrome P450 protein [Rutstroemia sp. NJR-2017a BBW]|nr:cytochrome P450 protein [Rutstroemia sp. NJR-2017a BBW]